MARPIKYPHETLLQRALDLFWTKGYEATSVQDLLTHLDIHKGTLYASFGDKHTLYLEVLAYYQRTINERLLAVLAEPGSPLATIRALFDRLVTSLASVEGRRGCLFTNATMESALADGEIAAVVGQAQTQLTGALERTLTAAQQAEEMPRYSSQKIRSLALFLSTAIQGLRVVARTSPSEYSLQQVAAIALSVLS
jgi:TetR/AcrR family transcriptional repressor of nem operon